MMATTTCTPSPIDALSKSNVTKGLASVNSLNHTTSESDGYFAFARINDEVYLVQGTLFSHLLKPFSLKKTHQHNPFFSLSVSCATPASSALTTVDVKIFRHEFITVFRFSEIKTFHPSDICIVEPIDDRWTRYEEENETVFLARDLVARLRMMANPRPMGLSRRNQMQQRSRQRF